VDKGRLRDLLRRRRARAGRWSIDAGLTPRLSLAQIARYFFRLGALGFGGPIALAGYMQRDLVERRHWFTQEEYLQGLAVSQTLPGPLAAQLAMWLGYVRRGFWGAVSAALPFILPPFVIVSVVAALYVEFRGTTVIQALFYGIGPAVIALILRGAWKLLRVSIKEDRRLWAIFAVVATVTLVVRSEVAVLFVIAGLVGVVLFAPAWVSGRVPTAPAVVPFWLGSLLSSAPTSDPNVLLQLGLFFFKAGAFTFGSGLAIVPFLQQGVVRDFGWLSEREFLDAVAMGMITPGPVVITAVFVGYLVAGLAGATVAGLGVFLPPFLMVVLFAPWIIRFRKHPAVVGFTRGATAAAAGAIVGAAAVIATQVLVDGPTVAIFAVALLAIWSAKIPEPLLVAAAGLVGFVAFAVR
jgi:chromate transporter